MRHKYIKPECFIVETEDLMLETISNPDGTTAAPDNKDTNVDIESGTNTPPLYSRPNNSLWDDWDE